MGRLILIVALALCAQACVTEADNSAKDKFVRVEDGRFIAGGAPYSYVGTNFWYGAILGSRGEGGDRNRLQAELDLLKSIGVDNLRILVGADGATGVVSKVEPTLQLAPGVYNDEILEGLDYLMMELGKRDMYAVLYLNNSWEWSGGYSQYLEWAGEGPAPVPAVDGWNAFMDYVGRYASNEEAKTIFRNYVEFIVTRTNRFTGLKYTEDPALMSWQIGNEPRAFGDDNKELYASWMADIAALIKSLDSNHLVSTGSEGKYGTENDIALWERLHADPNIDYMTIHMWPLNWGWIDKTTVVTNLENAVTNSQAYIDEHLEIARRYLKPVVLEEFGYPRDGYRFDKQSTTTARDAYYDAIFRMIYDNMHGGGMFAGCNFWAWGGYARLADDHVVWQRGDDYTGDPAQEEQGLNSVFAVDAGTLEVIMKYSAMLSAGEGTRDAAAEGLLARIREHIPSGFMFGHQDDTVYGTLWTGDEGRSDVLEVAGDYPAVIGFDLGHIELGAALNLDGVPFERMRREIISHHRRGGIVTLSWHPNNPLTLGDSWDVSSKEVLEAVLPGGARHELFSEWLDRVADFFLSLDDGNGSLVPVIFRPWHENTGSWFWWGEELCSPVRYKSLWAMTWLRMQQRGVRNLLYAYSPTPPAYTDGTFTERYPGDEITDIIGLDTYHYADGFDVALKTVLASMTETGARHGKPVALTETGLEGVTDENWWTGLLEPALRDYPVSYVLVWRNAHYDDREGHFYAPYPGHPSEADFVKFAGMENVLFLKDVAGR